MRSSSRSRSKLVVAAVLASVAVTGAAALTGSADAVRPAAAHRAARSGEVTPDILVSGSKRALTSSVSSITPGNTVFDIHSPGTIEVVSFRSGYSLKDLYKDSKKLFGGDVKVVQRVDKEAILWGGVAKGGEIAVNLPAGDYYLVNLDKNLSVPLTVAGTPTSRVIPDSDGTVKMIRSMTFDADAVLPDKGWITFHNTSSQPHFVDFAAVKKGTTAAEVSKFLLGGAQGQPAFATGAFVDVGVVSPNHSFEYLMDAPKGEYAELCFWPSNKTGAPHALMGMFDLSQLR